MSKLSTIGSLRVASNVLLYLRSLLALVLGREYFVPASNHDYLFLPKAHDVTIRISLDRVRVRRPVGARSR